MDTPAVPEYTPPPDDSIFDAADDWAGNRPVKKLTCELYVRVVQLAGHVAPLANDLALTAKLLSNLVYALARRGINITDAELTDGVAPQPSPVPSTPTTQEGT